MSVRKSISSRTLRREAVEETLAPGESVHVRKQGGKLFELRRVDSGSRDINAELDRLFLEIPAEGGRKQTDLARIIIENRE
jgi:hypothetical protein